MTVEPEPCTEQLPERCHLGITRTASFDPPSPPRPSCHSLIVALMLAAHHL
jgi:hypothetical protein